MRYMKHIHEKVFELSHVFFYKLTWAPRFAAVYQYLHTKLLIPYKPT